MKKDQALVAILISAKANKPTKQIPCDENGTMPLETLEKLVGGNLVVIPVPVRSNSVLVVSRDAKEAGKPLNMVATVLSQETANPIVGDAVLMKEVGNRLIGFRPCNATEHGRLCSTIQSLIERLSEHK